MKKQNQSATAFKVLVVDDNKDVADSLVRLINALGHTATQAYDGPSALKLAAAQSPDAVFLDIGMPHVDGYEVARQLSALQTTPDFRVIAVTGYADGPHREKAASAGFTDYLVKPYVSADIIRILSGPALTG